jgi:gamma-glutamyl phosphate reductase
MKSEEIEQKWNELCGEIEKLPASEQQTKVSILASELKETIKKITSEPITPQQEGVFDKLKAQKDKIVREQEKPVAYSADDLDKIWDVLRLIANRLWSMSPPINEIQQIQDKINSVELTKLEKGG